MPARRSKSDWIVDVGFVVSSCLLGALALAGTWEQHSPALRVVDLVLGVAAVVALWWRKRWPTALGLVLSVVSFASALAAGPALAAAFNVAVRGSRQGLLAVAAIAAAAVPLAPLIYPSGDGYVVDLVIGALLTAVVFGWGLLVRARREQVSVAAQRAVADARTAERRRIAREMHDVLAHRLSLLALHAGALEYRGDAEAGVLRETARAALEDLRGVIGILRDGEGEAVAEPPQPTLADLDALVDECRAAGMRVELSVTAAGVPDALGRTAYRIVQEGLTNARKHAPGAAVDVHVDGGDALRVTVRCRRPVGVAAAAPPLPGAGSGLIGLEERVALAGGRLHAASDRAGDFTLEAELPWSAS